jgi:hypothetical protein
MTEPSLKTPVAVSCALVPLASFGAGGVMESDFKVAAVTVTLSLP